MDFRAYRRTAGELSPDLAMDPTMQDAHDPARSIPTATDPVHTDGADPATPGGPAPYNAADPVSDGPVVDDPMWRDPTETPDKNEGGPIPHIEGPDEDKTTLHRARLESYVDKAGRYGSR